MAKARDFKFCASIGHIKYPWDDKVEKCLPSTIAGINQAFKSVSPVVKQIFFRVFSNIVIVNIPLK